MPSQTQQSLELLIRVSVAQMEALKALEEGITKIGEVVTGMAAKTNQASAATQKLGTASTDATKGIKGLFTGVQELFTGFSRGLIAIAAVEYAFKRVARLISDTIGFGKLGAQVEQTAESFQTLLDVTGAMPDVLDQIRAGSMNTVSELGMMSAVMTLAAGASNELAKELINATPQLMEIAKAASKLNPSILSTEEAFERLARGIKRSSPRILDDLGLLVKLGPSYEIWADQMERSMQSMSAEERQLALLNAVLGLHDNILTQVGGTLRSNVDAYTAYEAAVQNLKNAIAQGLSPAMTWLVNILTGFITGGASTERIFNEVSQQAFNATDNWQDYADAVLRAAEAERILIGSAENAIKVGRQTIYISTDVLDKTKMITEATWARAKALQAASAAETAYYQSYRLTSEILNKTRQEFILMSDDIRNQVTQLIAQKGASELSADAALDLSHSLGQITTESYITQNAMASLTDIFEKYGLNLKEDDAAARLFISSINLMNQMLKDYSGSDAETFSKALAEALLKVDMAAQNVAENISNVNQEIIKTAGLAAGLQGKIGGAEKNYQGVIQDTTGDLKELEAELEKQHRAYIRNTIEASRHADVVERIGGATYTWRGEARLTAAQAEEMWQNLAMGREPIQEIIRQIDELKLKQMEAGQAIDEATNSLVFNQTAQYLNTDATIELARALGQLSETDYAVASATQQAILDVAAAFKMGTEDIKDSVDASEALADRTNLIAEAAEKLRSLNLPVTLESISRFIGEMPQPKIEPDEIKEEEFIDKMKGVLEDLKGAIDSSGILDLDVEGATATVAASTAIILGTGIQQGVENTKVSVDLSKVITFLGIDALVAAIVQQIKEGIGGALSTVPLPPAPTLPPQPTPTPVPGQTSYVPGSKMGTMMYTSGELPPLPPAKMPETPANVTANVSDSVNEIKAATVELQVAFAEVPGQVELMANELRSAFTEGASKIQEGAEKITEGLKDFGKTVPTSLKQIRLLKIEMSALAGELERSADAVASLVRWIAALKSKKIKVEIHIVTIYSTVGGSSGGGGTGGGGIGSGGGSGAGTGGSFPKQLGADFIVPAGFPHDDYGPIYVQSGERVQITPAVRTAHQNQQRGSVTFNVVNNIFDEASSELAMASLRQNYIDTLNGRLPRG